MLKWWHGSLQVAEQHQILIVIWQLAADMLLVLWTMYDRWCLAQSRMLVNCLQCCRMRTVWVWAGGCAFWSSSDAGDVLGDIGEKEFQSENALTSTSYQEYGYRIWCEFISAVCNHPDFIWKVVTDYETCAVSKVNISSTWKELSLLLWSSGKITQKGLW